jgi:hypothetical protein
MYGGYYKFKVGDHTFVSLNTLLWDEDVKNDDVAGQDENQLAFLEKILKEALDKRVVLLFHYFPGGDVEERGNIFTLQEKFIDKFTDLFLLYEQKIAVILGAHVHHTQFWLFNDQIPMLLVPSFSTYSENNPGFATIDLEDVASNLFTHHIDLFESMNTGQLHFNSFNFTKVGLGSVTADNVRNMIY